MYLINQMNFFFYFYFFILHFLFYIFYSFFLDFTFLNFSLRFFFWIFSEFRAQQNTGLDNSRRHDRPHEYVPGLLHGDLLI